MLYAPLPALMPRSWWRTDLGSWDHKIWPQRLNWSVEQKPSGRVAGGSILRSSWPRRNRCRLDGDLFRSEGLSETQIWTVRQQANAECWSRIARACSRWLGHRPYCLYSSSGSIVRERHDRQVPTATRWHRMWVGSNYRRKPSVSEIQANESPP